VSSDVYAGGKISACCPVLLQITNAPNSKLMMMHLTDRRYRTLIAYTYRTCLLIADSTSSYYPCLSVICRDFNPYRGPLVLTPAITCIGAKTNIPDNFHICGCTDTTRLLLAGNDTVPISVRRVVVSSILSNSFRMSAGAEAGPADKSQLERTDV